MIWHLHSLLKRRNSTISEQDLMRLHQDDVPFMTDSKSSVVMGASRSSHMILACTALFFSSALTWAAFAKIDEVTRGEGKVIPTGKIQVIQNLEGGILTEILIKEGQVVEKNQPLLRLDDIRFSSSYRETRSKYLSLSARAARLKAEAEGVTIVFSEDITTEDPALTASELALFRSRANELESNLATLKQQESQTRQEIAELEAHKNKLTRSYTLLRQELEMSEPLVADGAISDVEILRLKRSVNDIQGEVEASKLAIPRLVAASEEARNKIADLEIKFRTDARSELSTVTAELSAVAESLRGQEDRVSRTLVRSPVRGTVKQLLVTTIGGVIQPGMDLLEIVPLEGGLLVEAHVRPADIAFLHPDQDAQVKLTAYDYSIYGGLPAKLEHISADTIIDDDGESFFLIRVRTEQSYLGKKSTPLEIIPGMTATVDILTGQKTVLDYLLKPVLRARERALRER